MGGGDFFDPGLFLFPHQSMAFYFLRGTVLDFSSARIMCIKTKQESLLYKQNKKVCYISADSDLEMDTRLIKSLVL